MRSLILALTGLVYAQSTAAQVDLEYGEYLSSECLACHLLSGKESNIPTIIAKDPVSFISVLNAYKNKELKNEVMQNIAGRLGPDEMASLAAYFATIKPKEEGN